MQTIGSTSNNNNAFRCFALENSHSIKNNCKDSNNNKGGRWFVYWIRDEQIFGVTDGMSKVYEMVMDHQMRRKLLGNVAESRLEEEWSEVFDNETFMVNELDEDRLVVSYIRQKEHLERLKTNIAERISELFYFAISSLSKKSYKPVDLSMLTNASPSKKLKAMPKSENRSLIDPSKRKRTRPTGLQLPD